MPDDFFLPALNYRPLPLLARYCHSLPAALLLYILHWDRCKKMDSFPPLHYSQLSGHLSYYPYPKTSCVFIFFIIAHQKAENNSSFCQIAEFKDQILNIKSISRLFDPQPLTDINQIRIL